MSRVSARAAVAAVTTGTVAVSGMALAGCATASPHDGAGLDEASVTSPIRLGVAPALSHGGGTQGTALRVQPVQQTILKAKDSAALAFTRPTITVPAGKGVDVGVRLTDATSHRPLAGQKVRMVVKLHGHWQTFKVLRTDRAGFAHYTANVLTTTRLTAVFDGGSAVRSTQAGIATLAVPVVTPAPSVATQASRDVVRTALTTTATSSSTPAPVAANTAAAVGSSLGARAVNLASFQAGKPYLYGGSGPYSFDCSGLVQYVYRQLGRSLPRTAEEQYEASTHVSQYSKQVGDLIFFGTPGNIYHVGIYAGNGNMWDAPHSGTTVQLQAIWSTSYSVGRVY